MACTTCGKMKLVGTIDPIPTNPLSTTSITNPSSGITTATNNSSTSSSKNMGATSYGSIVITPEIAPDITTIRAENFQLQLVEIEAANVVKGFCDTVEPDIAVGSCDTSCGVETPAEICINNQAETVSTTTGRHMDYTWRDAVESKFATILARVNDRLVKLTGTGVVWLEKGVATIRTDVPLKVSKLWHKWYLPTPSSSPLIGQPLPFPYQVVTDLDGNAHAIQGLASEDSISVWSFEDQHFYQKSLTDFPLCVRQKLTSANQLELVGFEPLGASDDPSLVRCLKKIEGNGILVFKTQDTAPSDVCECDSCESTGQVSATTSVAEFIPNPVTSTANGAPWILGYDQVTGTHQYYDASTITGLQGEQGNTGTQGIQGEQGDRGEQGTVGSCC